MRILFILVLLVGLAACKQPELTFPEPPPKPVWTVPTDTAKRGSTTASLPYSFDEYEPFATSLPSSATHRLKEIMVRKDDQIVAGSLFIYNAEGQLLTRFYRRKGAGSVTEWAETYAYDATGQLIKTRWYQPVWLDETNVYRESQSFYTNGLLTQTNYLTKESYYPLNLGLKTTYQYKNEKLASLTQISYFHPVCVCNLPGQPQDSTKRLYGRAGSVSTQIDTTWCVGCVYSVSTYPPKRTNSSTKRLERDAKGNAVSIETTSERIYSFNTPNPQTDIQTTTYRLAHQYNGPSGLLSQSENATLGLIYQFIYEPK